MLYTRKPAGNLLWLIVLLAFLHGLLYANLLPPWGLIDEAQHLHYIQHIAETGTLPIAGQTLLSQEIVDSLFATRHWAVFHWPTPAQPIAAEIGPAGHSYEAYQPPLFYLALSPLFAVLPGDILNRLFVMRWVMVLLSLATLGFLWATSGLLFRKDSRWRLLVLLLLVAIPERTLATSRLNNDVLLEVLGAALIWLSTRTLLRGLTVTSALGLGILLGLGLWTKLSIFVMIAPLLAVLWCTRTSKGWGRSALLAILITALAFTAVVTRNFLTYGDWTGISAFHRILPLPLPELTAETLLGALASLFAHTWVVWWKGAEAHINLPVLGFQAALLLVCLLSLFGIWRIFLSAGLKVNRSGGIPATSLGENGTGGWDAAATKPSAGLSCQSLRPKVNSVLSVYLLTVVGYAAATFVSYLQGMIPLIQGRFLLPAILPIVLLMSWGLRAYTYGRLILLATIAGLFILDTLALWGNLLPYFYYYSAIAAQEPAVPALNSGLGFGLVRLSWVWQRLLFDKPAYFVWILPALVLLYHAVLVYVGVCMVRLYTQPATPYRDDH